MNGEFTLQQAELLAARVLREVVAHDETAMFDLREVLKPSPSEVVLGSGLIDDAQFGSVSLETRDALLAQVQCAWRLTLCRQPTVDEVRLSWNYAVTQLRDLQQDPSGIAAGSNASTQVLVNFCHALMNSNEFVYSD